MKRNVNRKFLQILFSIAVFLVFVIGFNSIVYGQIQYSHHFTKKLEACGVEFIRPLEGYYKVKMKRRDRFINYDLVLYSEDYNFEMRFWLDPDYRHDVPHITAFSLVNSLAINEPHFDIHMNLFREEDAKAYFNANWAAYSDFIPKRSLSDKHFGRLVCIYHQDKGMIYNLMLFNDHVEEKDRRLYALQFQ